MQVNLAAASPFKQSGLPVAPTSLSKSKKVPQLVASPWHALVYELALFLLQLLAHAQGLLHVTAQRLGARLCL